MSEFALKYVTEGFIDDLKQYWVFCVKIPQGLAVMQAYDLFFVAVSINPIPGGSIMELPAVPVAHSTPHKGKKTATVTTTKQASTMGKQCDQCGKPFSSTSNLTAHQMLEHNRTPKFSCHFCGKGFMSPALHRNHENGHLNVSIVLWIDSVTLDNIMYIYI